MLPILLPSRQFNAPLRGILAAAGWRLVFIVLVPVGIVGAIWSYLSLREISIRTRVRIDWLGNVT